MHKVYLEERILELAAMISQLRGEIADLRKEIRGNPPVRGRYLDLPVVTADKATLLRKIEESAPEAGLLIVAPFITGNFCRTLDVLRRFLANGQEVEARAFLRELVNQL